MGLLLVDAWICNRFRFAHPEALALESLPHLAWPIGKAE
jgi:hypothetical protein